MLGAIHFNDQLCRCAIKIYNKSADNSLLVNFRWVFAEEKIPELAFMGHHFPAKPPGILQLASEYGHITLSVLASLGHLSQRERVSPSQSASPPDLPREKPRSAPNAPHRTVYRSAPYIYLTYWNLLTAIHSNYIADKCRCTIGMFINIIPKTLVRYIHLAETCQNFICADIVILGDMVL